MFDTDGANCIGLDPELFFPTSIMNPRTERLLQRTCQNCILLRDCLYYSLRVKVHGYWAGTTESQRTELRILFGITPIRIDQDLVRDFRPSEEKAG